MGPHMGSVAIGVSSRPIHLHALVTLLAILLRRLGRRCPSACSSSPAVCRLGAASCGWGISIAWLGCLLLAAWGRRISTGGASGGLGGLRGEVQTLVHLLRMHRVQLRGLLQVRHGPGRTGALMGWLAEASRAAACGAGLTQPWVTREASGISRDELVATALVHLPATLLAEQAGTLLWSDSTGMASAEPHLLEEGLHLIFVEVEADLVGKQHVLLQGTGT